MKKLTIIQLSNIVNMVPQYLYKTISKPEQGKIYDPENVNYNELKKVLVRKFGSEDEVCELLEIENFDELEITRNVRTVNIQVKLEVSEMIVGCEYIVKSYHHEHNLKLVDIYEVNNDKLYIFEDMSDSKISKDKYKVITEIEFKQSRYKVVEK